MVRAEPNERPDINQVLNDPWLNDFQEDNPELLNKYKNEFIKRFNKTKYAKDKEKNNVVVGKIDIFQGSNKSISNNSEDDYKKVLD